MSDCQKPTCTRDSSDTYSDEYGNELDLCAKHYYELVSGKTVRKNIATPSTGLGIGQELTRDIDRGSSNDDMLDFEPGKGSGTTPCPDCGKPMGMVTWTGEKPSCHRCQTGKSDIWMGVIDPSTGEEVGPTMNVGIETVESDGDFSREVRAQID